MLNIINLVFFIISPFLAIPTVVFGFVKKSKLSFYLLVLIFGIISFLYVPHINNDKARYYELYDSVKHLGLKEFFVYNSLSNLDFIFQFFIYLASVYEIQIQYVFLFVTSLTIFLLFNIFFKLISLKKISRANYVYLVVICVLSLSLEDLFSGFRFVLAISVLLNSYYYSFFENKRKLSLFLFFIAIFIHFSIFIFGLPIFLKKYLDSGTNKSLLKVFFLSILIMFIPQEIFLDLIQTFGFSGVFADKSDSYLTSDDFVSNSIKEVGDAVRIRYFLYSIWIYLAFIYIYITKKEVNIVRNIFLIVFVIMNIFSAFPTVFFRYSIFVKIILACLVIYEIDIVRKMKFKYLYLFSFLIIFLTQIMLMRYNFEDSFFKRNIFYLYDVLASEPIKEYDFLK